MHHILFVSDSKTFVDMHAAFARLQLHAGGEGSTTFKVGQVQDAGLVHPVVLAPLKEGVIQVGKVGDNALALGLAQQHVVPLAQPVTPGSLLSVGVAVQNIVVTLKHSTSC